MKIALNKSVVHNPKKVKELFEKIISSGVLTNNGPFVRQFEQELADYAGESLCLTTSSGTSALELAIKGLELEGEIITTPFSFIASSSSILWQHCTPVFADINPETLCIDPNEIKKCITNKTTGILAVHIFGSVCDIDKIEQIASENHLKTIYDGAHAFGINYKGSSVFNFGNVTSTSLHAYKIVNAAEGGALFTKDDSLFNKLFQLRYFGKNEQNVEVRVGTNAKMSEFNAVLGKVSLENISVEISARQNIALQFLNVLKYKKSVSIPSFLFLPEHNFSYFPIILEDESDVLEFIIKSNKFNIEARRYFYPNLNELEFLRTNKKTPIAHEISKRVICIPIYSALTEIETMRIIQLLETLR